MGFWTEDGFCLCWLIRHSLGWLFAGERAGRGTCVGWGGDFTLSTKSLGFYWNDSGWLVGTYRAGSTHCLLLTNLCSTGQVLVRNLEWGKGQRGFFYDGNWKFLLVFSTWEIFHLPTAPYLCGGNAAVVLWQRCESQCSLSQGTPELLGTTAAISDVTVLPCGPSGSQFAVDLTLLPFLEPGQGSLCAPFSCGHFCAQQKGGAEMLLVWNVVGYSVAKEKGRIWGSQWVGEEGNHCLMLRTCSGVKVRVRWTLSSTH